MPAIDPPTPAPGCGLPRESVPEFAGSSQTFELRRPEAVFMGRFAAVGAAAYEGLKPHAAGILHPDEWRYFQPLPAERRRRSFLLGRYAAKRALRPGLGNPPFAAINLAPGVFKNPVICYPMPEPWQVSISHSETVACALAFPMVHPMALDIESIDAARAPTMATQCRESERAEAAALGLDAVAAATLLWTAKEALSKALHTGMTCPFELFEVRALRRVGAGEYQGLYQNLAQYQFRSWLRGESILAICLPKRTEISFEHGEPRWPAAVPGAGMASPEGGVL